MISPKDFHVIGPPLQGRESLCWPVYIWILKSRVIFVCWDKFKPELVLYYLSFLWNTFYVFNIPYHIVRYHFYFTSWQTISLRIVGARYMEDLVEIGVTLIFPWPLFTKWQDILPHDLVNCRRCEVGYYDDRIALRDGNAAAEVPVKFRSD